MRIAWSLLVLFSLAVFVTSLPVYFVLYQTICTGTACTDWQLSMESAKTLQALGLSTTGYAIMSLLLAGIYALAYYAVALLIVLRKSDDWMAMLVGLMLVMQGTNNTATVLQNSLSIWSVLSNGVNYLATVLLALVFALFPNGRFVPHWTRWLMIGWAIVNVILLLPLNLFPNGLSFWLPIYILLWFVVFFTLAGAQLYRYFRVSNPLQRQQTKWVVFSLAIVLLLVLGGFLPILFSPSLGQKGSLYQAFISTFGNFLLILIPLSLAIAILRYRLWDVDVLINKTLVYGTLTATLALIYIGLVIGLQALLRGIISQDNSVAIVVSTLAIAALFQPLRHRIQNVIDRRFYRRKYDAAKIVEAFSATLRSEVDLNQLREHLAAVVEETMQPTFVSLWLRPTQQNANHKPWRANPPGSSDGR
jgi:hypothetical protein